MKTKHLERMFGRLLTNELSTSELISQPNVFHF